jgi:hypothetical protein
LFLFRPSRIQNERYTLLSHLAAVATWFYFLLVYAAALVGSSQ